MNHCIAGFSKVKNNQKLAAMMAHILRIHLTQEESKRIDGNRASLNKVLTNTLGCDEKDSGSFGKKLREFYQSQNIDVRADNVLAVDLVLTTSPEYFGEWHKNGKVTPDGQKKIDEWVKTQMEFLEKQFGKDAVKLAVLHLDETTPHIHVVVTPEEKKTRTYKNRHGSFQKEQNILNANRWTPSFWKNTFLKNYAKANAKFGLKRGIEGSTKKNVPLKEFSALVAEAVNKDYGKALEKMLSELSDDLSVLNTKAGVEKLIREKLFSKLEPMMKGNSALKKLLKKDRLQEYHANKNALEELEESKRALENEQKKTDEMQAYYGKGLKIRMNLEEELTKSKERIKSLEEEVKGLIKNEKSNSKNAVTFKQK